MDSQRAPAKGFNATKQQDFLSFDGNVSAQGLLQRPDRYRYWRAQSFADMAIPRGAGLSYAAASFKHGGLSVEHTCFNRVLSFDSVGHRVEVEAGICLAELYDFLAVRGLYLPIQPGHGRITVGGCVAADVHGKNQERDGTFIEQVESLTLFHPGHGILEVSRNKEPELFRLTCGGYGLTGHILSVWLRAKPIPSSLVEVERIPVDDFLQGAEQLRRAAQLSDFVFSWHDFTARGPSMGRGFVQSARFMADDDGCSAAMGLIGEPPPLSAGNRGGWRICLLNPLTTRVLNAIYRRKQTTGLTQKRVELRDALFPMHRTQSYFKLFGKRGFHEYQVIIPISRFEEFTAMFRDQLDRHPLPITLASAKVFRGQPELLRFTGDGICLTLNFRRGTQALRLLSFLDELTVVIAGKPNIIKDSRLPRTVVEAAYPGSARFRKMLRDFDPKRRFRSELSERLGL